MKNLVFFLLFGIVQTTVAQNLANLYKEVNSAVVVINTLSVETAGVGNNKQMVTQSSLGSGVLISKDGFIWTASHVVQLAEVVSVEFLDGDRYEAEVISSNPQADVALIKIKENFELKNKKVAPIGDSSKAQIGEDIFVLGAPHGLKQSLSRGIVSGKFNPQQYGQNLTDIEFIQTDASINPGNSGGPLFNMKGEVIGIASHIYSKSGGFDGIGFAASSNIAQKLLMDTPSFWSGMESIIVSGNLARALNVPQKSGLLVLNVSTKGIANEIGLQGGYIKATIDGTPLILGGDIILEIAGIKFEDANSTAQMKAKLDQFAKGEPITIRILRNGKIGTAEFVKQ